MKDRAIVVILGICAVLFIIGIIKKRYDVLVNFGLRLVVGLLGIYLFNSFLGNFGIPNLVGANSYNALIMGVFGVPGFVLIYGLAAYIHYI